MTAHQEKQCPNCKQWFSESARECPYCQMESATTKPEDPDRSVIHAQELALLHRRLSDAYKQHSSTVRMSEKLFGQTKGPIDPNTKLSIGSDQEQPVSIVTSTPIAKELMSAAVRISRNEITTLKNRIKELEEQS